VKLLVIHGPNLNMLGMREPGIYGADTLTEVNAKIAAYALSKNQSLEMEFYQSNHEGALIDKIHACFQDGIAGIIINPGGYTHTSIALRDAISAVSIPTVEVHLSNVHAREQFRQHSYIAPVAIGQIAGFGPTGYLMALDGLLSHVNC
jgi:3-dehydroquinate dehydratase-2